MNDNLTTNTSNEAECPAFLVNTIMCCFNCIHLSIKPSSGKHWCMNDESYLSGWISQPHIRKCELHVLEKIAPNVSGLCVVALSSNGLI